MDKHGFYMVSERFFIDFPDPFLKGNKQGNRPHYYAFMDSNTCLYWMIPLSSKVDKYERMMFSRSQKGKPNDIFHVCDVGTGKKSAFLIGDMFPITDEYIERAYTVSGQPLILKKDAQVNEIANKSKRVLNLIHRGVRFSPTQPNVLAIERELIRKGGD